MKVPLLLTFDRWLLRPPDNDVKPGEPRTPTAEESLKAMRGGLFVIGGGKQ